MLSKKFLSSALAIGLAVGFSLGVNAHTSKLELMDTFSDMLEIPGCAKAVDSAFKRMPDKIKTRDDVKNFHESIYIYFKQITSKKNPLTPEKKAQKIEQLTNSFKNLYANDVEFKEAFDKALYKNFSHASTPNSIKDVTRGKAEHKAKIKRCPTTSGE